MTSVSLVSRPASELLSPEIVDRPPTTLEERNAILTLLRDQTTQAHRGAPLVCACGFELPPPYLYGFRCFYCHLVFCARCARRHFGAAVSTNHG